MAKTNNDKTNNSKTTQVIYRGNSAVGWLALTFSIISLLFNVIAFNMFTSRANGFEANLGDAINKTFNEVRLDLARVKAVSQLSAIEAQQTVSQNYSEFESQTSRIRDELRNEFEQAGQQTSQEWQELNSSFDTMLTQIRAGTLDSISTLQSIIEKLRQNIAK